MALIHSNYIQEVQHKYEKWTEDTTLEICIEEDTSPTIKLDQQEQIVDGQWKILPLSSPAQVRPMT